MTKKISSSSEIIKMINDGAVEFVDFRFSDLCGKFHHITYRAEGVSESLFKNGVRFDGSSISGWRCINESDMIMKPDLSTAFFDPFTSHKCLVLICDIEDPATNEYYSRDPRGIAKRAQEYPKILGIADKVFFGCEPEFFMFDSVKFSMDSDSCFFRLESIESPRSSATDYPGGNMGHRPPDKGGYMPCAPIDSTHEIRSEILDVLCKVGITPILHHHEVAHSQCEVGFEHCQLTGTADNLQKLKYIVKNVAASYGKTATFMPKPIKGDNGSGLHTHQSLWKNGKPLFYNKGTYADLSDDCLYYIGGIMKHAKAINAFVNSTTNSYKRLIAGFEAPTKLAYSAKNRSAAIRIPHSFAPSEKRIEARFPDAAGNVYLGFAAMLMAGVDGIKNKTHPGKPIDMDLYHLSAEEDKSIASISRSLSESLTALDGGRGFLTEGNVFSNDMIDSYITLKEQEIAKLKAHPHPVEFDMYYSS